MSVSDSDVTSPDASADPLGAVTEEYLARLRRGERPSIDEYTSRFSELAERIRDVFPLLLMMEGLSPESVSGVFSRRDHLPPANSDEEVVQKLGHYCILGEVGRGGMGVVYEAVQTSLGRHVALKVLTRNRTSASGLERFQREARAAALLHHTNIVPVFDVGEQDGVVYYAMQLIHGMGLDRVLEALRRKHQTSSEAATRRAKRPRQGPAGAPAFAEVVKELLAVSRKKIDGGTSPTPGVSGTLSEMGRKLSAGQRPVKTESAQVFDGDSQVAARPHSHPGRPEGHRPVKRDADYWRSVARIGVQVAAALEYAHHHGTLHRDIKPSNLLFDTSGVVWVTDFGLAKLDEEQDITQTGEFVGTLRYMAPEQFERGADARSDVYSLGMTLYELLTWRPAFTATQHLALIRQVLHEDPPPPRRLDAAIPRDLETIVLKAIARDPRARYQSAGELAAELTRFLEDRPILARRSNLAQRAAKWVRRRPAIAALLVAVALVASFGAAGVLWQWRTAVAARADLELALSEKTDALTSAREQREKAVRAAHRAQQVSLMLQELFRGGDRVGVSAFLLDLPQRSSADLTATELLDLGVERVRALDGAPETQAELLETLAAIYLSLGRLDRADDLLSQATSARSETAASGVREEVLRMLIGVRYFQGRYADAEVLLNKVSQLAPNTAPELVELMRALLKMEQHESRATLRTVERALRAATDPRSHPGPLAVRQRGLILMYLSAIHARRNEHDLSLPLAIEAQQCLFDTEGGDSLARFYQPVVQGFMEIELADLELSGRRKADREPPVARLFDAITSAREELGPTHPVFGVLLVEVAQYFAMKASVRQDEWYDGHAIRLYRMALEGLLAGCGRQPRTADCMEGLALLLQKHGERSEAAELVTSALEIRRATLGGGHPETLRTSALLRQLQNGDHSGAVSVPR